MTSASLAGKSGLVVSVLMGVVNSTIQLVAAFGVNVSDHQNVAITSAANALIVAAVTIWTMRAPSSTPA